MQEPPRNNHCLSCPHGHAARLVIYDISDLGLRQWKWVVGIRNILIVSYITLK